MLCFLFFQGLLIAAFGFDDLAGMGFFVDLYLTRFASASLHLGDWSAAAENYDSAIIMAEP